MLKCKFLVVLVTLICSSNGLDLPADFPKCKRSDSKLNECLKSAIQDVLPKLEKGYPELKYPLSQPIIIPSVTVGEGTGAVHIVQKLKNVEIYNAHQVTIENVNATILPTGFTLEMNTFVPELKILADYDFKGQIFVLPFEGNGKASSVMKNVKGNIVMVGETFEKKGVTYSEVKTVKLVLDPTQIIYQFENLFGGDERLGAEMHKVLNENWKAIWEDVRIGYEESVAIVLQSRANIIFKRVPYDMVFPL